MAAAAPAGGAQPEIFETPDVPEAVAERRDVAVCVCVYVLVGCLRKNVSVCVCVLLTPSCALPACRCVCGVAVRSNRSTRRTRTL